MIATQQIHQETLINQDLTPTNARNLVDAIFDADINLQKRLFVTMWEKDHSITMDMLRDAVRQIEENKAELKRLIKESGDSNRITIRCAIEIEPID